MNNNFLIFALYFHRFEWFADHNVLGKIPIFQILIEFNHHANRAKATCGEFMKLVGLMPLKGFKGASSAWSYLVRVIARFKRVSCANLIKLGVNVIL